ncbi:MAG TPA: HEAT repeat domain-containing protein, partial [Anaeromyxobacteraceae bacterium]|nr:HEAT repeat domain-containing protein [Anaeromyxobacteraceae bacterium]
LDLFRTALREGRLPEPAAPAALDAASLETLFAALGGADEREAIAAMDLLAGAGRARLVPSFAVFHPSERVALHALALFERSGRSDSLPAADRLLGHPSPPLRAAALRVRTALAPERELLRAAASDPSALVRATAAVGLAALGVRGPEADGAVEALLSRGDAEAHLAVARALAQRPVAAFDDVVRRLAGSPLPEVAAEAARAMAASGDPRFLPALLPLLVPHDTRTAARAAFVAFGDAGLAFLEGVLADPAHPRAERLHVPRTISRFAPEQAAPILLARLLEEPDGLVRFKILRGLGRIVADNPSAALDRATLRRAIERTLEAAFRLVGWRKALVDGAREVPSRATPGHELLALLLRDKERHAVDRLFRLLALRFRDEDLESVHHGLASEDRRLRDSSRELLEHLLPRSWRDPILALVAEAPDEARLAGAGRFRGAAPAGYEALVAALLAAPGDTLRALAAFHAGEVGLTHLRGPIEQLRREHPAGLVARSTARALDALSTPQAEAAHAP